MAQQENARGLFESLFANLHEVASNLISEIFSAGQAVFFNGLAYSFIGLIAIFWLLKRIHKGGIDKEDAYSALIWISVVSIIYVIMSSESVYREFLNFLNLPVNYVSAITAGSFGTTDFAETFGNAIDSLNNGITAIFNKLLEWQQEKDKNFLIKSPVLFSAVKVVFKMFVWGIMYLVYMILILAITCICIVAKFMATIILSIAPIVIPCLMMNQLRGYFFSWLKLYLSYSMYAPLAMIIGNFPIIALEKVNIVPNNTNDNFLKQLVDAQNWSYFVFKPLGLMIIAIIGIMILVKVPSWVNQILGTQNDDSVGLAPLKAGAMALATGGAGYLAARAGGAGIMHSLASGAFKSLPISESVSKAMTPRQALTSGAKSPEKAVGRGVEAVAGYF